MNLKFPHAFDGVKKIFTAEIIQLVAAILVLIVYVLNVIILAIAPGANVDTVLGVGAVLFSIIGVLSIVMGIASIVAFIIYIVGVVRAGNDEPKFKTMLILIIANIIVSLVSNNIQNVVVISILSIASTVITALVGIFLIQGIISLAQKVGDANVEAKGYSLLKVIYVICILSVILGIVNIFLPTGIISYILYVIISILSVCQYILHLMLLKSAKEMLGSAFAPVPAADPQAPIDPPAAPMA